VRFIDLNGKEPEQAWRAKAKALSDKLDAAGSKEERDQIIDGNGALWSELKEWLVKLSKGKCWFSEARDVYSHWDIEHYRPKKAARDLDGSTRDGYWWLAFDWHNFRICGNVGNRKKGGFFPLREGTHQATPGDRNIEDEFPYLLDPTRPDDPLLLSFDENGDVKPLADLDDWSKSRAEESIKRYKLREHEPLMEARRDVWSQCAREVNLCQRLMNELSQHPSATKKEEVRQQMLKLKEMASFQAEFSAAACECLRTRSEQWAQRLAAVAQTS
jgi:uncharacterized protein (TIGR02646 family)